MEPAAKRVRLLTDHFRVALKPRDLNVALKRKEIELVTISDDEDENNKQQQQQHQSQPRQLQTRDAPTKSNSGDTSAKTLAGSQLVAAQPFQPLQPLDNNKPGKQRNLGTIVEHNGAASREDAGREEGARFGPAAAAAAAAATNVRKSVHSAAKQARTQVAHLNKYVEPPGKHLAIQDYDKAQLNNINWEPHYAWDSFQYDRKQEIRFKTIKYLDVNVKGADLDELEYELTVRRRAELINWLVDIQMTYVLDHESLYMAIKLADQYLMRKSQPRENYLLLFMTCILVSSKFDERVPPINISDLIQLARTKFGVKHSRRQVIALEIDLLTTLNFEVRYPLSYGFLRRFARCTRCDMKTLHLARYILESSLMDYEMIEVIESKMAAGSLLLAFEMLHGNQRWDETAKFYSGYDEQELLPLIIKLNDMILRFSRRKTIIRRKYSDESFMEVARIPPVMPGLLAQTNR